ncbi:MAG: ribonuclease J [Alphaproteobacteria bacterium]
MSADKAMAQVGGERAVLDAAAQGLVYLPLGGAGEIGMNFYLYGCKGKWVMVELGITFAGNEFPGIDIITPDPGFAARLGDDLLAIVLTHAHEDHLGAVSLLWPRLRCPIYATPFAAGLLRFKLEETGLEGEAEVHVIEPRSHLDLGPFAIDLITVAHSIPEANALAIHTPLGTVLHTGDWKLDPAPMIGDVTDEKALKSLGDEGVLAMVCDSTNVFVEGSSGSEGEVRKSLAEQVGRFSNRVFVTCFASNVARLESVALAALAHGRHPALVGRSLWRISEIARATGYLRDIPPFLTEHDVGMIPPDKILILCTGSQGERNAALARIAAGDHANVVADPGDAVLFSSRVIPGNEREVSRIHNQLIGRGVTVVTDRQEFIHVSGHPARDEMRKMYEWVRPHIAIPMHGETRHLHHHEALAKELHTPEPVIVTNGEAVCLAPGPARIVGRVAHGRFGLDGAKLVPLESKVMASRQRIVRSGTALVSLVLNGAGDLAAVPQVSAPGLLDDEADDAVLSQLEDDIEDVVSGLNRSRRCNDDAVATAVGRAVRRSLKRICGKAPVIDIHVIRV